MRFGLLSVQFVVVCLISITGTPNALAAQRGDADGDRDIDVADFSKFQLCFNNSTAEPPSLDCSLFDFNGDGKIDLDDFKALHNTLLGPGIIPPTLTDTSIIIGKVFHAQTGQALEGARVTAVFYPASEGEPDLSPVALTDADGSFKFETVPIGGATTFLLRIRKEGFAENLRRVEIMAGRCWRVDDAHLNPVTPPVMVTVKEGGMLVEPTSQVTLEIPPGALMEDSEIGITVLSSEDAIRDKLPQLVAGGIVGTYIDISGVFGDQTNVPVTMRVPNTYNLPIGTELRFGKIDHNTLEWMDLEEAFGGSQQDGVGIGVVKSDDNGGTVIEVQFDHFCSVCTGYCLPFPTPSSTDGSGGGPGGKDGDCGGAGNSLISFREGDLSETVELPPFQEWGQPWGLALGYSSSAASPSITLTAQIDYDSTRPVERTIFEFNIEGVTVEAAYDFSQNDHKHHGTFFWDGRNGLGDLMPTGTYPYSIVATSLNADTPVAISAGFGEPAAQTFGGLTYPGLTSLRSEVIEERVVLVNLSDSPYGAGWSVLNEHRLHFDPDGCVVLLRDNADWRLFVPRANAPNSFDSPAQDFTSLVRNPADGTYVRLFDDGTIHHFAGTGRLDRIVDRYGYVTQYTYENGLLTRISSPTGYFYDLEYAGGKLTRIIDSAGRQSLIGIDASGDLTSFTNAVGSTRQFGYDSNHLLVEQIGPRGERTEYEYANGRVVQARAFDVDGTTLLRTHTFGPSALKGEARAALAVGLGTLKNPIPVVEDRSDTFIDGRGETSIRETDLNGFPKRWVDPLGREALFTVDENGLLLSRTRPDGSVTEFEYDDQGNRTLIHELTDGSTIQTEYDGPFQQVSKSTNALGNELILAYFPDGNLSSIQAASPANTASFEYQDATILNLPTRTVNVLGNPTLLTYEPHGNIESLTDPLLRTTSVAYDAAGNVVAITDPNGETTNLTYDDNNRPITLLDSDSGLTQFAYGDTGCGCSTNNLTGITFPNNTTMSFRYDGLNRLVETIDQVGHSSTFSYDPEGNLVESLNRNGERITFQYDAVGQPIRKELPGSDVTIFGYDLLGNLSSASNSAAQLESTWDFLSRLTRARQTIPRDAGTDQAAPLSSLIEYEYNLLGNRVMMRDQTGVTEYTYDNINRVTGITDPALDTWTFVYNPARLTEIRTPNGTVTRLTYNVAERVTEILHATDTGVELVTMGYDRYDDNGNNTVETLVNSADTWNLAFAYDALNRLLQNTINDVPNASLSNAASVFDDANRLLDNGTFAYTYDNEGRLTAKQRLGSPMVTSYEYDAESRLLRFTEVIEDAVPPLTVVETVYAYDPFGRRVMKNVNGAITRFVYEGPSILRETDDAYVARKIYTNAWGFDRPLAVRNLVTQQSLYYHADRLGSIVAMTDASGTVVQEYVYDAFGAIMHEMAPSLAQPLMFTAREFDRESGMYYYRNRYYDPTVGRFITEDPIGFAGGDINFYNYVAGNPVNFRDPTGLGPVATALGTLSAVAGAAGAYAGAASAQIGLTGAATAGGLTAAGAAVLGVGAAGFAAGLGVGTAAVALYPPLGTGAGNGICNLVGCDKSDFVPGFRDAEKRGKKKARAAAACAAAAGAGRAPSGPAAAPGRVPSGVGRGVDR